MSRGNKWIPMDQYLAQDLKLIRGRPFNRIEAMYSYTLDQDKGVSGTIAGYAMQWSWSRNKVRRFINSIRTDSGHVRDSKRTHEGHPIHFIDKALMGKKDRTGTGRGQVRDRLHDTTIHPKPKTKEGKDIPQNEAFEEHEEEFYLTKKGKKLSGKRLESFNLFWAAFNYKKGKAGAADSWIDIPVLKNGLVNDIVKSAELEASARQEIKTNGGTPIYAQGWIKARRWEDEPDSGEESAEAYAKRRGLI